MNHFATTIALVAAMALAIGCGRAEEAANDAAKATQDAASAATARVEDAAAKAGSAAGAADAARSVLP